MANRNLENSNTNRAAGFDATYSLACLYSSLAVCKSTLSRLLPSIPLSTSVAVLNGYATRVAVNTASVDAPLDSCPSEIRTSVESCVLFTPITLAPWSRCCTKRKSSSTDILICDLSFTNWSAVVPLPLPLRSFRIGDVDRSAMGASLDVSECLCCLA